MFTHRFSFLMLLVLGFSYEANAQKAGSPVAGDQAKKTWVSLSDIKCEGGWNVSVEFHHPDRAGGSFKVEGEELAGPDIMVIDHDFAVWGKLKITGRLSEPDDDIVNGKLTLGMQLVEVLDLRDDAVFREIRSNKKFNWEQLRIDDPAAQVDADDDADDDDADDDSQKNETAPPERSANAGSNESTARPILATQQLLLKFEIKPDRKGRIEIDIPFQLLWKEFSGVKRGIIYSIRATHPKEAIRVQNKRAAVVRFAVETMTKEQFLRKAVFWSLFWLGFEPNPHYWLK